MKFRMGVVTVEVDDSVRRRLAIRGERLRLRVAEITAYVRSAGDDVETVGGRVRTMCDAAAARLDTAIADVNERVAPPADIEPMPDDAARPGTDGQPHLRAI